MMGTVGRLGRILGHEVLCQILSRYSDYGRKKAVEEIKAGKVEYRVDKSGIIHVPIGKASFEEQALLENLNVLMDVVIKARPQSVKGGYIKSVVISSTMGPGIKINPIRFYK